MTLYFITTNKNKVKEVQQLLDDVKQLDIELPEIQDVDPKNIIAEKLKEAFKHHSGPFILDDTSLCFDALNGLPGPLIRWFLEALGREGLWKLCDKMGVYGAQAKCMLAYAKSPEYIQFFEGVVRGRIVAPRGDYFGWDPVFQPDGYEKTFAELAGEQKNSISHRRLAVEKLKEYLNQSSGFN